MPQPLTVLLVGIAADGIDASFATADFGPYSISTASDHRGVNQARSLGNLDAAILDVDGLDDPQSMVKALTAGTAVVIVTALRDALATLAWSALGAEDILVPHELLEPTLAGRVRAAIERKRAERASRKLYATDLTTGLPHQQQLVEHMSQLLALREREPAPMAVLVLRIEGFTTTQSRLGADAADSLRRKIAVRLRAAVRASDVVAALDDESYAVLLGSLLAAPDAQRVATKLAQALMEPFSVGGIGVAVAVAVGRAHYPDDGVQPDLLLRKAVSMALDEPAQGRVGMANFQESGARPLDAANDE
jgi:diguanylate cyclase (GGDEF)-like protein